MSEPLAKPKLGLATACSVVIASMVGVGVFSTLSFQVHNLPSPFAILVLWAVGALVALFGALCYAELGAALPRSGGEYHLLGRIFHPALGFLAGWVSLIAGFAAPIAAAAIAFAAYTAKVFPVLDAYRVTTATVLVILVTAVHAFKVSAGARFQVAATILKVLLMALIVVTALIQPPQFEISFAPQPGDLQLIFGSAFAVSLVYVSYAYSGWNAAIYLAGETQNPQQVLPKALALSTLGVAALYLCVNYAFLSSVPISEMLGVNPFALGDSGMVTKELAVGFLAGKHLFGPNGATVIGGLIALCLVSTTSAMVLTGPRVLTTMAEDYRMLATLATRGPGGAPIWALLAQLLLVCVLLWTASFETVISYIGITLSLFASLTVLGLIWLRIKEPDLARPFRCPGYPLTPALFLLVNGWMLYYLGANDPKALGASALTLLVGGACYFAFERTQPQTLVTGD